MPKYINCPYCNANGKIPEPCRCGELPVDNIVIPAPPLQGEWRYDNLFLCCGTMRIARIDIDTNPNPEFIKELFNWVCLRLNEKQV